MPSLKEWAKKYFLTDEEQKDKAALETLVTITDNYIKEFEQHMLKWQVLHNANPNTDMAIALTIQEQLGFLRGQ